MELHWEVLSQRIFRQDTKSVGSGQLHRVLEIAFSNSGYVHIHYIVISNIAIDLSLISEHFVIEATMCFILLIEFDEISGPNHAEKEFWDERTSHPLYSENSVRVQDNIVRGFGVTGSENSNGLPPVYLIPF